MEKSHAKKNKDFDKGTYLKQSTKKDLVKRTKN